MDREDEAWGAVEARWSDEDAHRTYLAAHTDLEGLAEAGRRYKGALERDPGDAVALRWRDEVVRRATAIALAQLPRTAPPRARPALRRVVATVAIALLLAIAAAAAARFVAVVPGARP